jgi:hypothetical protein
MESKATLVWAKGRVKLHTVTTVDLGLKLVIFPDDTELNDALWDGDYLQSFLVFRVLFEKRGMFEGGGQLCNIDS